MGTFDTQFLPTSINSLALWMDANDSSTITNQMELYRHGRIRVAMSEMQLPVEELRKFPLREVPMECHL